jgi:hypothetical protein
MKYFLLSFLLTIFLAVRAQRSVAQTTVGAQKTDTIPHLKNTRLHEVFISKNKKLPDIQKVSVYAPDDLQIDGSMAEWDNHFRAFNKTTGIFYTISNNDEYVFLAVQAKDKRIINKLMGGGLRFTISNSCMDTDTNNVSVLFPLMPLPVCYQILHTAGKTILQTPNGIEEPVYTSNKKSIPQANTDLAENMRYIKIAGINAITDLVAPYTVADTKKLSSSLSFNGYNLVNAVTGYAKLPLQFHDFKLIPIQNKNGIKAITRFDKKGAYNYELAIPLRYLNGMIDKYQKFGYSITLHGFTEDRRFGSYKTVLKDRIVFNADLDIPTGFWAEYVLAE